MEDGGRSWVVAGKSKLLLATGGGWQSVYETPQLTYQHFHLAVSGSGGIWLTHRETGPSGPVLLHHHGTTQTRHELSGDLASVRAAEDGAGNVYLGGIADGHAYLARWDGANPQRLALPVEHESIVLLRGARGAGVAWAAGRSFRQVGGDAATAGYDLYRVHSSNVEAFPDPLGPGGNRALDVRRDGVPYLAGKRQVAWLYNGTWRMHWLEGEGWEAGDDLYVDDAGVMYLLVRRYIPDPDGSLGQNPRVESAVLIIRP